MEKIVLLMCGKNKLQAKALAKDLYISERFKKSIEYAKRLTFEGNIYILSAKHGLLGLNDEIAPYDKSIYEMNGDERNEWAKLVISQLKEICNVDEDTLTFLTDDYYCQDIVMRLKNCNCEFPLKGINQEKHIDWYNEMLGNEET